DGQTPPAPRRLQGVPGEHHQMGEAVVGPEPDLGAAWGRQAGRGPTVAVPSQPREAVVEDGRADLPSAAEVEARLLHRQDLPRRDPTLVAFEHGLGPYGEGGAVDQLGADGQVR